VLTSRTLVGVVFKIWTLVAFAIEGDWTLVTKNSYDFRGPEEAPGAGGQYRDVELHAGLICLNAEEMDRALSLALFGAVLDNIEEEGELINMGLEITTTDLDPDNFEVIRYNPPASADA